MRTFVDISGTQLNIGDKVAVQYQQLFRIGVISGFTAKKVIVDFDFSATGSQTVLISTRVYPWKIAKVVNQNIGLQDYYRYIENL
jgi:hypothetical protein